jgi:nitrate reductase assembly molybdenum cofactor insertion protein NarJ
VLKKKEFVMLARRLFNYPSRGWRHPFAELEGNIDQSKIEAKHEDEVLRLTLPKAEKAMPDRSQ